jgi:hypothetical protein
MGTYHFATALLLVPASLLASFCSLGRNGDAYYLDRESRTSFARPADPDCHISEFTTRSITGGEIHDSPSGNGLSDVFTVKEHGEK